ncbi:phage virion morphogenesis protein [Pasteurella multocida]|uniref:phage virion morphogenesis protein n=1 Tax=Pasteurella multocida TaxID=747 RepID=UPI00292F972E|nr:phage virion morphogenesis protein [Pasteurella multocida]WNY75966.1 phage virion morphogenesis protein [Pasteurella multocida]
MSNIINFEFDDNEIQRALANLLALGQGKDLMRKVANIVRQDVEDAFDHERAPDGKPWDKLDKRYQERRYKNGYDGKILQMHGNLLNSLDIDYGDRFALIGVSEPYGQYHQKGTDKMPARPFLGVSETGVEEIKQLLQRELKKASGF